MKKILTLLLFTAALLQAQSNNVTVNLDNVEPTSAYSYSYTLTNSVDTITITPSKNDAFVRNYSFHRLQVKSTGTDTLKIMILGENGSDYAGRATIDLSDMSTYTFTAGTPVSTTSNEFIIADAYQKTIRIISTSKDASTTTFTLKYQK